MVGLFAYLLLKDFQVGPAIKAVSPDQVRRLTRNAYYWCWVFGTTYDIDLQELAYFTEKGHNQLRTSISQGVAKLHKIKPTTLGAPSHLHVRDFRRRVGRLDLDRTGHSHGGLRLLDDLNRKYRLEPRPPAAEKAPASRSI